MSHRPLTILHLTAPAAVGGLESVVRNLTSGLQARGHNVVLGAVLSATPEGGTPPDWARARGVTVVPVVLPPRSYLKEYRALVGLVESVRPDVVHTHGYRSDLIGGLAARRLGIPWVSTLHGFTGGDRKNRLYEWLQVRACRRAEALVAVSRPIRERLVAEGVSAARVVLLPNAWVETPRLSREEARRALGLTGDTPLIGWVGRLTREKGADVFLEALALIPDLAWRASILGAGRERSVLEAQAQRLGIASRITWHGVLPDAARLFPAFDAWVLSSRTEGTPIALFEAVAARVPVIATAVGGVPDVVSAGEAHVVPAERPDALATALAEVLADPSGAGAKAEAAIQRLRGEFGEAAWLSAHLTTYEEISRRS